MITDPKTLANYDRLVSKVERVRSHWKAVLVAESVGLFIISVLPLLFVCVFLDNVIHLSVPARIIALFVVLSVTVFVIVKNIRALRSSLADEQVAVHIEKAFPKFNNLLINAVQLGKETTEETLPIVSSVIEDGLKQSEKIKLNQAVSKSRLKKHILGSSVAICVILAYALFLPRHFGNALIRILNPMTQTTPISLTRINVQPGNTNILIGDDVEIQLSVSGKVPESAEIAFEVGKENWELEPMAEPGLYKFAYTFKEVSKDIEYYVAAGDARSKHYTIKVNDRPNIGNLKLTLTYPDYTELEPTIQENANGNIKALIGAKVDIQAKPTKKMRDASIKFSRPTKLSQGSGVPNDNKLAMEISGDNMLRASLTIEGDQTYEFHLTDTNGFPNKAIKHSIEAIKDQTPSIQILKPKRDTFVKPTDTVLIDFDVSDDYGIHDISLCRLPQKNETEEQTIHSWSKDTTAKSCNITFDLKLAALKVKAGDAIKIYAKASDWNDVTGPNIGKSRPFTINIVSPDKMREEKKKELKASDQGLAEIIQKQEENKRATGKIRKNEIAKAGHITDNHTPLDEATKLQTSIRELSKKFAGEIKEDLLPLKELLEGLIANEMVSAIQQLKDVTIKTVPGSAADKLAKAIETQDQILRQLKMLDNHLSMAESQLAMQDVFSTLEEIIKGEKAIRKLTDKTDKDPSPQNKSLLAPAVGDQEDLATEISNFREDLADHAKAVGQSNPELEKRFLAADKMIQDKNVYDTMLTIAGLLDEIKTKEALPAEDAVIAVLEETLKQLKDSLFANAEKRMEEFKQTLDETKDKLKEMEELEKKISAITEELNKSRDESEKDESQIGELGDLKDDMAEITEELANDLQLFPEIPVSNELLSEMKEIYEDVQQVPGSEDDPVQEIATVKDEGILEAIEKTKERVEDMEMWLSDKPDTVKWNMESFEVDEIPEIPLVDLPEELEDMVGDLLDQQEDLSQQAQDSTSNNISADMPMGWDVMDGNISNFSAKGKSGNTRPNDNEITGRSGAGRQGRSNGELVENFAKDLEGSPTPPRRTNDPFQKGNVEEENPNSQAGATGGGKQSGFAEEGFSGTAPPRNELPLREMERKQRTIRQNAERLYTAASLLYLPTGALDTAIPLMKKAEEAFKKGDLRNIAETQKLIAHSLRNTSLSLGGKTFVQMDAQMKIPKNLKDDIFDAKSEDVPSEYKDLVSEYYKVLSQSGAK